MKSSWLKFVYEIKAGKVSYIHCIACNVFFSVDCFIQMRYIRYLSENVGLSSSASHHDQNSPTSPTLVPHQQAWSGYFCKSFVETTWKNVKLHCHLPQVIVGVTGHAAITMSTDGSQFISDYHKQFDICFIAALLILFQFFCRLFVCVLKVTSNSAIVKKQSTKVIGLVMQCCDFTSFLFKRYLWIGTNITVTKLHRF